MKKVHRCVTGPQSHRRTTSLLFQQKQKVNVKGKSKVKQSVITITHVSVMGLLTVRTRHIHTHTRTDTQPPLNTFTTLHPSPRLGFLRNPDPESPSLNGTSCQGTVKGEMNEEKIRTDHTMSKHSCSSHKPSTRTLWGYPLTLFLSFHTITRSSTGGTR